MNFDEPPQFLKEFSKSESPEERNRLAQEIREKRKSAFGAETEQIENNEANLIIQGAENLRDNVESYNNNESFQKKINNVVEINKTKNQFAENYGTELSFEEQLKNPIGGLRELDETRDMLANFYDQEKQKWSEKPYTKEDVSKYFDEENLKSLSVDDYALLLKRFPGNMVTHVTRQGVRDHFGISNHIKGLGEFHNNFKAILEKKQLNSAIGMGLQESSKEQLVSDYLDNYVKEMDAVGIKSDREGAITRIGATFDYGVTGSPHRFADSSAIHVATEQVADAIYGGERGNEIFFAFPSAFIASQMEFGGQLKDKVDGSANDQRIWANFEKGINLEAGLVFIPEDAEVDAKTGSKYELDEKNKPIVSEEYVLELTKLTESADFTEFADQAFKILGRLNTSEQQENVKQLRKTLAERFDINNRSMQDAVLNYNFLNGIKSAVNETDASRNLAVEKIIKQSLMDSENLYLKSKDTVKSKEYWESYFAQNPEKRPSKIVYYKGGDPTKALFEWRNENGISKKAEEEDIGFEENRKLDEEVNKSEEQGRFMSIAKKIIDERFPINRVADWPVYENEPPQISDKDEPPPIDEDEPPLLP